MLLLLLIAVKFYCLLLLLLLVVAARTYSDPPFSQLSEIINSRHENVKYLPGVELPSNVRAVPKLREAAEGADVVIFCMPHQFCADVSV